MNIGILFNNTSLSKSHRSLEAKTDRWLNFCIRVIRQTPIQALTGCRSEVLLIGYRLFFVLMKAFEPPITPKHEVYCIYAEPYRPCLWRARSRNPERLYIRFGRGSRLRSRYTIDDSYRIWKSRPCESRVYSGRLCLKLVDKSGL